MIHWDQVPQSERDDVVLKLMLIRHGLTDANAASVIQGHQPTPLNAVGLAQAKALGKRLAKQGPAFDVLVSSDLPRAVQTAEAIAVACNKPFALDAAWRERGFGPWEGKPHPQADIWRAAGAEASPAGAEETSSFRARIVGALAGLSRTYHQHDTVAVVTHGGPCRMILRLLIEGDLPTDPSVPKAELTTIVNCSIMHLQYLDGVWRLECLNDVLHLAT